MPLFPIKKISALAGTAALLPLLLLASAFAAAPPVPGAKEADAPRHQVRFELRLTRDDSGDGNTAPVVLAEPRITTIDRNTASISITGGEPSYTLSLSPTIEPAASGTTASAGNIMVLWNLRLSGKTLPGVTAISLSGASRVAADREEALADVFLKDPRTGKASRFLLYVKTIVSTGGTVPAAAPAPAAEAAAPPTR